MTREQYLTGHMPYEGVECEDTTYICPVCGAENPQKFYLDDYEACLGCSECVSESDYPGNEVR